MAALSNFAAELLEEAKKFSKRVRVKALLGKEPS